MEAEKAEITGTKFQLGDKIVAETTVAELVNGYNLDRKEGTQTYTVTMVGLDQSSREWIKIDGTNQSVKSVDDFVLFSELRDVVMKRLTNRLLRMMSYNYGPEEQKPKPPANHF